MEVDRLRRRRRAAWFCTIAAASLPLAMPAAAEVPWATAAVGKPAAPPLAPEWASAKFQVDKDEWRDTPRRHRFVHGCFTPSHLCMSMYLPPKELYRGRFVNHMEGGSAGLDKMMTQAGWDWAFNNAFDDMGAYLVETNEGHYPDEGTGLDKPSELWLANAAGVRVSRGIAEQMYGKAPARGYITGCSGGGMRSELGFSYNPDLYDGAVSQAGHGGATTLGWAAYSRMGTLLGKAGVEKLVDAADVGGSGEIFAGLTPAQAEAVSDFFKLGYPRDAVTGIREYWAGSAPVMLSKGTEGYYTDFWTKPGYEGHDNPEILQPYLFDKIVTVKKVLNGREVAAAAGPIGVLIGAGRAPNVATYGPAPAGKDILDSKTGIVLDVPDMNKLFLARVTIQTGPDAGKAVYLSFINDGLGFAYLVKSPWGFDNVNDGDKVRVDNRDYLAFNYQYRHNGQVVGNRDFPELKNGPNTLMPELRSLLTTNNKPIFVQSPHANASTAREREGQMAAHQRLIYVSGSADEAMWPAYIGTHLRKLHDKQGAQSDNRFRMWWMEGVPHCSGPLTGPMSTNRVPSEGIIAQGLVDVMNWAERGIPAPATTGYRMEENSLILSPTAAERHGIQPVVKLAANGGARAEVGVGTPVTFTANAEVPPGTGSLIRAEWDFDGKGAWPRQEASMKGSKGAFTATFAYDKPGVYFPAVRVASRRVGVSTNATPVYNIARTRVVVK